MRALYTAHLALDLRLIELAQADRITTVAAYYVYCSGGSYFDINPHDGHIASYTTPGTANYERITTSRFVARFGLARDKYTDALTFITHNENCAFEDSQKQRFIREVSSEC